MNSSPGPDRPNVLNKGWIVAAISALLAFTLACSITTPPIAKTPTIPTPNAAQGLIAYVGVDGNIYTIDRDGKQRTAITQDANSNPSPDQVGRIYQFPTWAPSEQTLAFMGFSRSPQTGTQASLFTASSDGKTKVEAFTSQDSFPFYLFWSPNSKYVTFLGSASGGADLELRMAAAAGGDSKLIGTGQPFYWDWSPDNRSIIAHTGGAASTNPDARLALYQLDGAIQKKELDLKPGLFQAPAWSPGGSEMVLTTESDTGAEELVLAGRDGTVKRVLAQLSSPAAFAWSPKGDSLAYTIQDEGDSTGLTKRLVLIDPAQPDQGKEVEKGPVIAFFWSPDGQKIAYFSLASDIPGGISQNIAQTNPKINLDIQVYTLGSGETKQITTFSPTESFLQVFPFFDQYQRSGTLWSPDSTDLALASVDNNGNPIISVVGADGGKLKKIADGDLAFWSWK